MKPKPKNLPRGACVPTESRREDRTICGGSPQDEPCANSDLHGTARSSSAPEGKKPATVPLYLIARVVEAEVARHKRAVREIHVVGAAGHYYTVTVVTGGDRRA
jgi:hypothetical protein